MSEQLHKINIHPALHKGTFRTVIGEEIFLDNVDRTVDTNNSNLWSLSAAHKSSMHLDIVLYIQQNI